MASGALRANIPLTYEDYVYLPTDGRRYEIMQGDLYVSPAPNTFHQTVSRRLQYRLMALLEDTGIAYIFNAPCAVLLSETDVVQPDLVLVRCDRRHIISDRGIDGAPDVVIEILSPSTKGQDLHLKKHVYARAGVQEYWIVDPDAAAIEQWVLEPNDYRLVTRFDRAATLTSTVFPEISIHLLEVFKEL